ncbi:SUMO-activating enzyme subunit 1 [Irineochytrium annulatum]|nr:SUMO-activating enzyme subunit 1 [Irineochytrium annulatum]
MKSPTRKRPHDDESSGESAPKRLRAPDSNQKSKPEGNGRRDESNVSITPEEAALYDRQIRLWGLEAQTQMRNSNILVVGLSGLSNEICKNLVLAGIGSLTLCDHEAVKEENLGAQFFLAQEDVGTNRAEAAAPRVQNLNPRVKVTVIADDVMTQSVDFFGRFNLMLICSYQPLSSLTRVNNLCRQSGTKFIYAHSFGFFGFAFTDFGEYHYIEERKGEDGVPKRQKKVESFVSLEASLKKTWSNTKARVLKRTPPLYFGMQLLWRFEKENHRLPDGQEADEALLLRYRNEMVETAKIDGKTLKSIITPELLRVFAEQMRTEISPVCAIMGGIVAQDALSAIASKEVEINNHFCFSALDNVGMVIMAGPS